MKEVLVDVEVRDEGFFVTLGPLEALAEADAVATLLARVFGEPVREDAPQDLGMPSWST